MANDVYAEAALLECCQQAADLAQAEGATHIEIVHLALALLHTPTGRDVFARRLVEIDPLVRAVADEMERSRRGGMNGVPEASQGFLHVLQRAEQAAADSGRDTVTLPCVVDTILEQGLELEGGAFLKDVILRDACGPRDGQTKVDMAHQENAAARIPNRNGHLARHHSNRRHYGIDAYEAGKRDQVTIQVAATDGDDDPFQLRVDGQTDEASSTTNRMANLSRLNTGRDHQKQEPSTKHSIAAEAMPPTVRGIDDRLREMQRQLSAIAAQMHFLGSQHDQPPRIAASAGVGRSGDGQAASNTTPSRLRGPSERDWTRIARLLERLEASTQPPAGQVKGGRSMHHRQRRRKSRIRASRQDWRRRLMDRFERPRQDRSDAPWSKDDDQHHSDQRPSRASSPLELDQHGFEDEDGDETDGKRFYLHIDDEIVRAPSIGPRTAERLTPHGVEQVSDLLAADAADLAERVKTRHITTRRIEDWQMQARLVCTVPWLRGTHAQLLVGAGYTTPGDICSVSGDKLSADILKFASTRDGQRVLRAGPPPEMEKILRWAENAAAAELDRAA